jgi:lipopolysaccharide assembly outer membrane protein LptD (OstA)
LFFAQNVCQLLAQEAKTSPNSNIRPDKRPNSNTVPLSLQPDSLTNRSKNPVDSLSRLKIAVADTAKGDLQTTVHYMAQDSSIIDEENQTLYLFGNAKVIYGDIQLEAYYITLNWRTNQVNAVGRTDSTTKEKIGFPVFTQDGTVYNADSIKYNFKSRKGLIKNIITTQDEGYVQGKTVKKDENDNMYLVNATYTTCDMEHPHFNILASKIKMVNGKKGNKSIIAGPFRMVLNEVPFPIPFPFGFFPVLQNKENGRSGILFPTYGEEPRGRGFFLKDGGYYFAINEYITAAVVGDIYSKGGWGLGVQSSYAKKYRYSGSLNFRFNLNKTGDEYIDSKSEPAKDFNISWSHSPISRGTGSFGASVSLQSSGFGARNAMNTQAYLQSTSNSSVSYSKTFGSWASSGLNFRINQNMITNVYQGGLGANFALNQIAPLKRKNAGKEAWYESFRFGFNLNGSLDLTNDIRTQQTTGYGEYRIYNSLNIPPVSPKTEFDKLYNINPYADQRIGVNAFKNWQTIWNQSQPRVNYSIPISLPNFKFFKYLNLTPSISTQGDIFTKRLSFSNITENDTLYVKVDTTRGWGFYRYQTYSFSTSLNTRLYGTMQLRKGRVQALRHTIAPSVSLNYTPDFSNEKYGYYQTVKINDRGDTRRLSRFVGSGGSVGQIGGLSFSIANQLEAKLKARSDTAQKDVEKINLIDNLGISGGYNFLADSFKLTNIGVTANTVLFKKYNINAGANLSPYGYTKTDPYFYRATDPYSTGRRLKEYRWNTGQGIFGLENLNFAFSTQFAPKQAKKEKTSNNASEEQIKFINKNPQLYVDFSIPWTLALSYNFNYTKIGFAQAQVVQALTFNGDVSLTEKWKISYNSGYDFVSKSLTYTSVALNRDLHCWDMNLNWIPVAYGGRGGAFSFELRARSSILQELKLSKRGSPSGYVNY